LHQPFRYLLTVETAARRDGGEIRTVAGTGGLRFEEADDGAPETVAADTIPNARNADVRETLEDRMPSSFDACESVVLELHVDWPNRIRTPCRIPVIVIIAIVFATMSCERLVRGPKPTNP